jgi:hypothetical protein
MTQPRKTRCFCVRKQLGNFPSWSRRRVLAPRGKLVP